MDYKEVIFKWCNNKRGLKNHVDKLNDFFQEGFINTKVPYKVYFGGNDHGISFLMGGTYLIGYTYSGEGRKGIWMLQDKIHVGLNETIKQKLITTTKNDKEKLYWLHTDNIENLKDINSNQEIWASYSNASIIINKTKHGGFKRWDYIRNKELLTEFHDYSNENSILENDLEIEFERELQYSNKISSEERKDRINNANKKPNKIKVTTNIYLRNSDVVAEVLNRANGRCEICKNKAPFIKACDGSPYLEVHHILPLSKGGEDSLENTLGLCPNCHREQHFGK